MKHVDLVWWPLRAPGFGVFLRLVLTDYAYVHIRRWILLLEEVMDHKTNRVYMFKHLMCLSTLTDKCGSVCDVINTVATETEEFTRLIKPVIVL
jgi:hypothetical protein